MPFAYRFCRFSISAFLICLSMILGSCAHKAKLIQAGAVQFEVESLAAIQKIDELRRKEVEAAPLSKEKASDFFTKAIKQSTGSIDNRTLNMLVQPLAANMQKSEAQWQAFLQSMRLQYSTFAETFTSLDKGSLLGASRVPETVPVLDKLVAQMVATASSIKEKPAEFIRERAAIAAEIEDIRDKKPYTEVTDIKLLDAERRLREIVTAEEQITKDTIGQVLKAAKVGSELRKLLINYNTLSIDDIAEGLSYAFKLAGNIPGLDISGLKAEADSITAQINNDATLKEFLDKALAEISAARKTAQ